jgi:hypothetical protein
VGKLVSDAGHLRDTSGRAGGPGPGIIPEAAAPGQGRAR